MITVLFPAGMFGSTIEFCLRRFSKEIGMNDTEIFNDGSMHSFVKLNHLTEFTRTVNTFNGPTAHLNIATPVYPTHDSEGLTAAESVLKWKEILSAHTSKMIFIRPNSESEVDRNDLFSFHKTKNFRRGFMYTILHSKEKHWNLAYQSWKDMQNWEVREALSFYCDDNKKTFNKITDSDDPSWLCINADDILYNFVPTIKKIFAFCDLTFNLLDIEKFYNEWFKKQQYIIEEYNLVEKIFDALKKDNYMEWDPALLSVYSEAIIQSRLRSLGIELACTNLNNFPKNTTELKKFFIES